MRSIGEKHEIVGVQASYYEVMNRNLMHVIAEELAEKWDEQMQDAWSLTFSSITSIIKHPRKLVKLEPVRGWGLLQALVCAYIFFYSPFRMGEEQKQW